MELAAVLFGVAAALSWGAGDFSGGIASKRNSVLTVVLVSQCIGWAVLFGATVVFSRSLPSLESLYASVLAGAIGMGSVVILYRCLSRTKMGIVAPVTAITSVVLPVAVGMIREGMPPGHKLLGFGFAVVAVLFLTAGERHEKVRAKDVVMPFLAGCGLGLFYIILDRIVEEDVLWPLVAIRLSSILLLASLFLLQKRKISLAAGSLTYVSLAGVLDIGGNLFFALGTKFGRLDITSVLSSLYPAATVFLARLVLQERLSRMQWTGVSLTMVALTLVAL